MTNQAAQTMPELPVAGHRIADLDGDSPDILCYTADQMHQYARDYAAALSQTAGVPDVLFDGYAVYQGMTDEARARINAGGVSDVLDSVVRLIRAQGAPAASGGERAPLSDRLYRGPAHDPSGRERGTEPQATPESIHSAAASVSERARVDALALDVAHRFTQDTEPQRRASLQVAVIAAIEQALTQQRVELPSAKTFASAVWRDWMTNEQADKLGAELHAWLGAHVATTPQPSADAVRELVQGWRMMSDPYHRKCANELESLLSGGSHA